MPTIGRDEQTWLTFDHPAELVHIFGLGKDERRMRLWCAGCCRQWWAWLSEPSRAYLVVLERHADGLATLDELRNASGAVGELGAYEAEAERQDADFYARCVGTELGWNDARAADEARVRLEEAEHRRDAERLLSEIVRRDVAGTAYRWLNYGKDSERASQLLRDIFGNPFRPTPFSPEWRTDTAIAIARGMYEARDFSAMPILADALQDADCDSDAILNHCRDANAAHVRGCWAVDLVLGKA